MKWKTTRVSFDHITRLSSEKSTSRRPRGPLPLWSEEGFFYAALTLLLPPSPRYFTMLANYRHCIPSHLFSPTSYHEATFLSLFLSAVCPIFGPPTIWMRSDAWKRNTRRWRETRRKPVRGGPLKQQWS